MFAGIGPEAGGSRSACPTPAGARLEPPVGRDRHPAPAVGRPRRLDMPVLVITGEHDGKFTVLGRGVVDAIGRNSTDVVVPAPAMPLTSNGPARWRRRSAQLVTTAGPGRHRAAPPDQGVIHHSHRATANSGRRPTATDRWRPAPPGGPGPKHRWPPGGPAARPAAGQERQKASRVGRGWPSRRPHCPSHHADERQPSSRCSTTGSPSPDPNRQCALSALGVGADVPQIVGQEKGGGQQPDSYGGQPHHRLSIRRVWT